MIKSLSREECLPNAINVKSRFYNQEVTRFDDLKHRIEDSARLYNLIGIDQWPIKQTKKLGSLT